MPNMYEIENIPNKYIFSFRVFLSDEDYVYLIRRSDIIDEFFMVAALHDLIETFDEEDISTGIASFPSGAPAATIKLFEFNGIEGEVDDSSEYFVFIIPVDSIEDAADVLGCLQDTVNVLTAPQQVSPETEKWIDSVFSQINQSKLDSAAPKKECTCSTCTCDKSSTHNEENLMSQVLSVLVDAIGSRGYVDDSMRELDDPRDYLTDDNYQQILPHISTLKEMREAVPSGFALEAAGIPVTKAFDFFNKELQSFQHIFLSHCIEIAVTYEKLSSFPKNSVTEEETKLKEHLEEMLEHRRNILSRIKVVSKECAALQEYLQEASKGI